MYKGTITNTLTGVQANTNIPFQKALNTNSNTIWNDTDNTLAIVNSGYYDIMVNLYLTNITTDVTVQVYNNGEPIAETLVAKSATMTSRLVTVTSIDTIRVANDIPTNRVNLSVRIGGTTTTADIVRGVFIVEKRR